VQFRDIAAVIGCRLGVPVVSKTPEVANGANQPKWSFKQPGLIANIDRGLFRNVREGSAEQHAAC
jgi:hypothetical protein